MYHIVYKTISLKNNKFYIGVHKSTKLMDEYLGSGKWIVRSIKKHGHENFIRENLFVFYSAEEAFSKEAELVSIHLGSSLCMNIKQGGYGGFDYINKNGENPLKKDRDHARKISILGNDKLKYLLKNDPDFLKRYSEKRSKDIKNRIKNGDYTNLDWTGKHHSEESKRKISEACSKRQGGSGNSQYGTYWITKDDENKKVKEENLEQWLILGWRRGRAILKSNL